MNKTFMPAVWYIILLFVYFTIGVAARETGNEVIITIFLTITVVSIGWSAISLSEILSK